MRTLPLLVAMLATACTRNAPPAPPAPAPEAVREAPVPRPIETVTFYPGIPYCVVRDGRLESVEAVAVAGGDTVYGGMPLSRAFPTDSTYSLNASWYRDNEPISFARGRYVKYGLPRILGTTDVVPVGTYYGVTVFVERGMERGRPEVLYIPVRPGCKFQPYMGSGVK